MDNKYPETIPDVKLIDRFIFDTNNFKDAKHDVDLKINAYSERMKAILDKYDYKGHIPILEAILQMGLKSSDLEKLSKGLKFISEIIDEYERLQDQATVLKVIKENPNFLAWAFGSFTLEEDTLEQFLTDK